MRAPGRRALGAVVAVLGIALAGVGALAAYALGPSGETRFSVTAKAPGAFVVVPGVLNSVDVPVRVTANRSDGGAVFLAAGASADARAVLATSAVSTVSGVHYPAGTLDIRTSGAGALPDISKSDVWRLSAKGARSAELVVDQGNGPETAVVTSGDASPLTDVKVTLTWANSTWLAEALVTALIGAIIAAFALTDLWHGLPRPGLPRPGLPRPGRHSAGRTDAAGTTTTSEVTV